MKRKSIMMLSGFLMTLLAFTSCNKEEDTGLLSFGLELTEEAELKSTVPERQLVAALVSIVSPDGSLILDKEPLELLRFGDRFVTRSLKLPTGEFALTEFMLVDAQGEVLWATPMEGSPLAHLVRDPLPQHFGIHPGETTSLDIQVVRIGNHPPHDFGYVEFGIGFVNAFCLKVMYATRYPVIVDDSLAEYDSLQAYDEAGNPMYNDAGMPYYMPRLLAWSGDHLILDKPLVPGLNRYPIPVMEGPVVLQAYDYTGNVFYEEKFMMRELMKFRCADNFPPLVIHHGSWPPPGPDVVVTPEGLTEPNIEQGVFGQLVFPWQDSLDQTMEIVSPLISDIYIYPGHVLDSIYTFAPMGCTYPEEWFAGEPVVGIVRSNSMGYFQLPLRAGEYLYLVRTPGGFYVDMMVSSRRGGYLKVSAGEVTILKIPIMDCAMIM